MGLKIFIIGPVNISLQKTVSNLEVKDNSIIIAPQFINDISYKDTENENNYYYLDNESIEESIKNNSILYIRSNENVITGVTFADFYNSDIISLSIMDFNSIPTNFLNQYKDDILLVWLDTIHHRDFHVLNKNINEVNYLENKINEFGYKYIYLLDPDTEDISNIVIDYFYGDDNKRKKIIEENT